MSRPTLRRLTSVTALTAMALSVLPATSALAARDIETFACPPEDVEDPGFSDDDGVHEAAIHCIVWYGIAGGRSDQIYGSRLDVSRGAMATFLANLVVAGGVTLPTDPENAFDDDDDTTHEDNINALAELGVVEGTGDRAYEPNRPVRRGQMATFLNNAYEAVTGEALTSDENAFDDDDDTTHESNINAIAAAEIADGVGDRRYAPTEPVRRDQMASFVARTIDLLVEEGFITPPRDEADNETALDVPELLRVEPVSATTVRFVFDEALNSTVTDAAFGLYSFDATRTAATATSRSGTDTVLATFPPEAVESAVLAAVAAGAVQADDDAATSIEGHAPLQDVDLAAGSTAAPDLVTVTVAENTGVFTFDDEAFVLEPTGYHLVLANGTDIESTAVEEGDSGTTEHTVTFALDADDVGQVAYGYVDDGTVSDEEDDGNPTNGDEGDLNVLQEANVSQTGTTNRPDLTDVQVVDATTVRYVFDENVTRVTGNPLEGDPGDFRVYFADASTATAESSEGTSNNTITATFAEGDLDGVVTGGIVDEGTVSGANGANLPQERGIAQSFEAGDSAAPELVSATIADDPDSDDRLVRYVFDDVVEAVEDGSAFKVYTEDGTAEEFEAGSTFPPSNGSCTIDAENARIVECVLTEEADPLPEYLVAAVERGAVSSAGGYENAEGAAVL